MKVGGLIKPIIEALGMIVIILAIILLGLIISRLLPF